MKNFCFFVLLNAALFFTSCATSSKIEKEIPFKPAYHKKEVTGNPVMVSEVWGWVLQGREKELDNEFPLTDVGYFSADIDSYGSLSDVPDRNTLSGFSGRVHLVLTCESKTAAHFILDPKYGIVDKLINEIMSAGDSFDGIQIDYEYIPGKDADNFISFLEKLSKECKKANKIFSVCVPARTKTISDDMFPYKKIASLCDRVMVMIYDEHWSTSKPGPIASPEWCSKIADYSVSVIPEEKLVAGVPFYGRTWCSEKTSQGWYYSGVNRLMRDYNPDRVTYKNDVPNVVIKMNVDVSCWFEDSYSVVKKLRIYESKKIDKIAFWRIGMEDPDIWKWIEIKE